MSRIQFVEREYLLRLPMFQLEIKSNAIIYAANKSTDKLNLVMVIKIGPNNN